MARNNTPLDIEERNNGHSTEDIPPETQEQLDAVMLKVKDIKREGILTIPHESLSLMQAMLYATIEEYKNQQWWRMCDFQDEEEAADHIAAFYEAKELGMDTTFNVAYAFSLCSVNRKSSFMSNLISVLNDTLQHGKWAMAQNKKGSNGNKGGPLSS